MKNGQSDWTILIAEDDDDDFLLTRKALADCRFDGTICRAKDGEELMEFLLKGSGRPAAEEGPNRLLLLLDLNMPRKDGREALREIKTHPELKSIPVIVLTTSMTESDIKISYDLGANSFIRKPDSYERFVDFISVMKQYWFEVTTMPRQLKAEKSL
jgi:CheY-like chemotaxis protein